MFFVRNNTSLMLYVLNPFIKSGIFFYWAYYFLWNIYTVQKK